MNSTGLLYFEMDARIEKEIESVCTSLFCQLCDVKIASLSVERSHYSCKRHLDKVATFRSEVLTKLATEKAQASLYSVKAKVKNIVSSKTSLEAVRGGQYNIPKKMVSPDSHQEPDCNGHMQFYPHPHLAKLKSDLVKKGISKEYWTVKANGFVICTICNAELQTHNSMLAHLESDRHIQMYEFWCSLYNADKTERLIYCKTCNIYFDEAKKAKKHFSTDLIHMRNAQIMTSPIQQNHEVKVLLANNEAPTPKLSPKRTDKNHGNNMINADKPSSCLPELASNQVSNIATNNSVLCNTKQADTKTEELSSETAKLKQNVFNELNRLVQKLYYSNSVPYTVSLEYLKRINKEVDELATKYDERQKASEKSDVIEPELRTDISKIDNDSDFLRGRAAWSAVSSDYHDVSSEEWYYSNDSGDFELPKFCPIASNSASEAKIETSTSKPDSLVECSPVSNALPNKVQKKAASISELFDKIRQRRQEIIMDHSKEGRLERELLSEMEVLMLQIEKNNIPLAETLKCLEKFNKELDTQSSSNEIIEQSRGGLPDDQKIETVNTGNGNASEGRINQGGHEVFYADKSGIIGSKGSHSCTDDKMRPEGSCSTCHRCNIY